MHSSGVRANGEDVSFMVDLAARIVNTVLHRTGATLRGCMVLVFVAIHFQY